MGRCGTYITRRSKGRFCPAWVGAGYSNPKPSLARVGTEPKLVQVCFCGEEEPDPPLYTPKHTATPHFSTPARPILTATTISRPEPCEDVPSHARLCLVCLVWLVYLVYLVYLESSLTSYYITIFRNIVI